MRRTVSSSVNVVAKECVISSPRLHPQRAPRVLALLMTAFFLFQQLVQPFKTLVPILLEFRSPNSNFPQGLSLKATPASLGFASALDEACPLWNLEEFGDGGLAVR